MGSLKRLASVLLALTSTAVLSASPTIASGASTSSNDLLTPTPTAKATPPPGLRALEPAMELLHVASEQFTATIEIESLSPSGLTVTKAPKGRHAGPQQLVKETAEIRFSPSEGTETMSSKGLKRSERLVGGMLYVHEPDASKLDGGRPWVRSGAEPSPWAHGDPAVSGGEGGAFTQLVSVLNDAEGIAEESPTTIDGVPVEQFTATYSPGVFPLDADPGLRKVAPALGKPSAELVVFINSVGLPVRTRLSFTFSRAKVTLTADITAINITFPTVLAPPAAKTIGESAFATLEEAHLRKELHKLKKRLAKKSGK